MILAQSENEGKANSRLVNRNSSDRSFSVVHCLLFTSDTVVYEGSAIYPRISKGDRALY